MTVYINFDFKRYIPLLDTLSMGKHQLAIFVILSCFAEFGFYGVYNGWSALYLIFDPKTTLEISRANLIYVIANIAGLVFLIPQGLLVDIFTSKKLFIYNTIAGILGYFIMIFASWNSSSETQFCQRDGTLALYAVSQSLINVYSNGVHLSIMCYIPSIVEEATKKKDKQEFLKSVLFTVANGAYSAGPLVLLIVYYSIGTRNWFGLGLYSGVTIIAIIIITVPMFFLWKKEEGKKFNLKGLQFKKLIPYLFYNIIYTYFMVCFISMITVRTSFFTGTFSLMLPLIGVFMTFFLSFISKFSFWSWSNWQVKSMAIVVIGYLWTFIAFFYTVYDIRTIWIISCIIYCIFCPVYYSVTSYYFNEITPINSIGLMRGIIMAITGPFLFTLDLWIKDGIKNGYLKYDLTSLIATTVAGISGTIYIGLIHNRH